MTPPTHDTPYLFLISDVLNSGIDRNDRTGTGTRSVFGRQMRFDLSDGSIPLLTTKKMHWRSIIVELLWYIAGDTNNNTLDQQRVKIWNEWADPITGELGKIYGHQWRNWGGTIGGTDGVDQLAIAIDTIKNNPESRRIIVNSWNVSDLGEMNLPPCHFCYQFYVDTKSNKLSMIMHQRSCDIGLGVPFNIVQYSILLHMVAQVTGLTPHEFIWSGNDCHIYHNHIDQLTEQLTRGPYTSPSLDLNRSITNINDFVYDDFKLIGYDEFYPSIKMEVAV